MRTRNIFFLLWILLLLIPLYTIFSRTDIKLLFSNQALLWNVVQRLSGLTIFTLLPLQIVLGAFMTKLTERFGSWIFWFHITQASLIYSLILLHPVSYMLLLWRAGGPFDPFYIFTDYCLICETKQEFYITFGRVSFVLFTMAYLAGKFRTVDFLRKHWKKFHIFNYLGFFLIAFHANRLGSDIHAPTFYWYYWVALGSVSSIAIYKLVHFIKKQNIRLK